MDVGLILACLGLGMVGMLISAVASLIPGLG